MTIRPPESVVNKAWPNLRQRVQRHPLLAFSILHAVILLGVFTYLDFQIYSDPGGLERWFALSMINGQQLPYRDLITEYPPLTMIIFILPGLLFREPLSFSLALAAEILIVDIVILVFLAKYSRRLDVSTSEALGVYTLCLLAVGPLTTLRHDLVPAMLVIVSLYAFGIGKTMTSWVLLGLGVMTKVYPLVLAPLFFLYYMFNRKYIDAVKGIGIFAAVVLLISLPWLLIDSSGFLSFLTYHAGRGLQSESSYATVLLMGQVLGLSSVEGIFNFSSWNISSPTADLLAGLSPYIMFALLSVVYVLYGFTLRRAGTGFQSGSFSQDDLRSLLLFSLLAILVLILTDKVFSPQYIIWVCPLIALYAAKGRYPVWFMFVIAGIFTQYVYPYHYGEYELVLAIPVTIETMRNLLLLIIAGVTGYYALTSRVSKTGNIIQNSKGKMQN